MSSNTQREQARARIRKQKMTTNLIWGGIGVAVIAAIGFFVWQGVRPAAGESMMFAISNIAGIGQGFRDTNQWLAVLTNQAFPVTFYAGDALGSFNSWARIITANLAGIGIVGLVFPYMETSCGKH